MILKRMFDVSFSSFGIFLLLPLLVLVSICIFLFSGFPIFFIQIRTGRFGKKFNLIKFRSMVLNAEKLEGGSVTTKFDPRITGIGLFIRKWKLDELPSLWNVLIGNMGFVGPRPDVPGYSDQLKGEQRKILNLRPGITGPATLKYANEELILSKVENPIKYNKEVIFPDKVKINLDYVNNWTIYGDIKIILNTIFRRNYL